MEENNPKEEEQDKKELEKIIQENANPKDKNSPEYHIKRILNTKFLTPFEVLQISPESSDDQIKRKYRSLTLLIHPDKCHLPEATEAFQKLETSYKTLTDPDKKKYYLRILNEAKERIEVNRNNENKLRLQKGLDKLPEDNLDNEIREMMRKIIEEIEEKKNYKEKMDFIYKKREREAKDEEERKEEEEKKKKAEWDKFRDKRVKNWNRFKKKNTSVKGKGKYELKPPKHKTEERDEEQHITLFRPNTYV